MEAEGGYTVHTARSTQGRCVNRVMNEGVLATTTSMVKRGRGANAGEEKGLSDSQAFPWAGGASQMCSQ